MMTYRPAIDGLRAVAILPVLLFHAGFDVMQGGFVGVDVFFVISGYLITALILKEKEAGSFSLLRFYERRARRILPALFFVMLCCVPFGWFWLLPNDLDLLADSMIAVVFFVSNIHFYRETGYFAPDAELQPLLHTWSLSIEEQFYLLFPLLIILFWSRGLRWLAWLIGSIAALSLLTAQFGGHVSEFDALVAGKAPFTSVPDHAFYLLPARAWELLAGALAAFLAHGRSEDRRGSEILALIGLAMIVYAIFAFDDHTPHPSFHTLLPVGGAVLIVLFATPETLCARLLSIRPLVGIGLISYSVYLWHQPLFVFFRVQAPELDSPSAYIVLTLLSLGLGWLSWRFVETPFRDRKRVNSAQIFRWSAAGAAVVFSIGLAGHLQEGFIGRFPKDVQHLLAAADKKDMGRYVYARHERYKDQPLADDGRLKVLVIGDSFGQDFVNMLAESSMLDHASLSIHEIASVCGNLYLDADFSHHIKAKDQGRCRRDGWYEGKRIEDNLRAADVIFLASAWSPWVAELLPESVENLKRDLEARLVLVGGKYFGAIQPGDFLDLSDEEKIALRKPIRGTHTETNLWLARQFDEETFLDIAEMACAGYQDCPVFTPDLKLISYDGSHLTKEGAVYLGQRLRRHPLIREVLHLDAARIARQAREHQ